MLHRNVAECAGVLRMRGAYGLPACRSAPSGSTFREACGLRTERLRSHARARTHTHTHKRAELIFTPTHAQSDCDCQLFIHLTFSQVVKVQSLYIQCAEVREQEKP